MKEDLQIRNTKRKISHNACGFLIQPINSGIKAFLLLLLFIGLNIPQNAAAQTAAQQNQARTVQPASVTGTIAPLMRGSYADVVEKVTPAVVTVRSEVKTNAKTGESPMMNDPLLRQFFGNQLPQMQQQPRIQRGLGSGIIVESNGIILTNNHVVDDATQVKVDLPDRRTFTAKVIGTDPASDLAVLKIDATDLPTLPLGDSDKVRVGDVVLAIGNPLGLRQTVTSGIISAKGRQTGVGDGSFEDFLQTDAPINQGNSGGALVNVNGELVGINSQILSPSGGSIGLGFSIPSNMAKSVMAQLISGGKVHRGMLGVGIQDVTSDLAGNFGLKDVRGVIVNSVTPNSPAERAGLKQGDVIRSFNGVTVNDGNELRNRVAQTAPNSEAAIGISRNGSEQTVNVKLGEFQPKEVAAANEKNNPSAESAPGKLGLSLQPITPQIAQQYKLKESSGLIVADVQAGSPADEAGIQQGDVILQVNRQDVKTVEAVKTAMTKMKTNSVLFLVSRDGQSRFVSVEL